MGRSDKSIIIYYSLLKTHVDNWVVAVVWARQLAIRRLFQSRLSACVDWARRAPLLFHPPIGQLLVQAVVAERAVALVGVGLARCSAGLASRPTTVVGRDSPL